MPRSAAKLYARLPLGPKFDAFGKRISRYASARDDVTTFQSAVMELLSSLDRIHSLTDWGKSVLLLNGAPGEKIDIIRTGLPLLPSEQPRGVLVNREPSDRALRLAYWGRINRVKGIHVLLRAIQGVQSPVTLMIAGILDDEPSYIDQINTMIVNDPRVTLVTGLKQSELFLRLRDCDVAVFPSIWPETGPLTVLEAWAAGLPVIGSDLGGIAELCSGTTHNILFKPGDHEELASIINRLSLNRAELEELARGVKPPRTMSEVAADTVLFYNKVL
jgi:glycosyltransferase involved in cell wall biosynthesis